MDVKLSRKAHQPASTSQDYGWYLAGIIPVAIVAVAFFGASHYLRSEPQLQWLRQWAEVEPSDRLANPIQYSMPKEEDHSLVFEVAHEVQNVRAMMNGKIVEVNPGKLEIEPDAKKDVRIVYAGLTSVTVGVGQNVFCGQKIGVLKPTESERAVLRINIERGSAAVVSPDLGSLPSDRRSTTNGGRLYFAMCAGCHHWRKVAGFENGKLKTRSLMTPEMIIRSLRPGGSHTPSYTPKDLSDSELQQIASSILDPHERPN